MVDLLFIDLRVMEEVNSDIPFFSVYRCVLKLSIQEPNDFLRVVSHYKLEATATNPPSYLKHYSSMKRIISLFRMNKM